jgi:hypothetical protein
MLKRFAFFFAVLGMLVTPSTAQDVGVAFSTASNGAFGSCYHSDIHEAASCAQESCASFSGLSIDECTVSLWCSTPGWFAALKITPADSEEFYFDFLCNEPTFEKLQEVAGVECAYEGYTSCEIFQVWDPSGVAQYEVQ